MQSISLCLFWSTEKAPRLQNLLKFRAFFSQRSVWMPCRRKMQTFWSWLTEKRMLCQINLMNQRISQPCCYDVWLKPAPTKQSMHYSAMPLAHPPLATTRHTSHRPTLRHFNQQTRSHFLQIGLSDVGLPGWSTSLARQETYSPHSGWGPYIWYIFPTPLVGG